MFLSHFILVYYAVQGAVKIMAKDLVRTKAYITKFHNMRSQLQAVKLRMTVLFGGFYVVLISLQDDEN